MEKGTEMEAAVCYSYLVINIRRNRLFCWKCRPTLFWNSINACSSAYIQ